MLREAYGLDPLLVCTGSPKGAEGELRAKIGAAGLEARVRFLGYRPTSDMPALSRGRCRARVPSLFEGFVIPLLEAMWCDCPIVCSNTTSLPEIAGDAALLVDPRSSEDLAHAMSRVLTDTATRQALIEHGRRRVSGFSWQELRWRLCPSCIKRERSATGRSSDGCAPAYLYRHGVSLSRRRVSPRPWRALSDKATRTWSTSSSPVARGTAFPGRRASSPGRARLRSGPGLRASALNVGFSLATVRNLGDPRRRGDCLLAGSAGCGGARDRRDARRHVVMGRCQIARRSGRFVGDRAPERLREPSPSPRDLAGSYRSTPGRLLGCRGLEDVRTDGREPGAAVARLRPLLPLLAVVSLSPGRPGAGEGASSSARGDGLPTRT